MNLGLWALIGGGIIVSCLVAADAIGRVDEAKRERKEREVKDREAYLAVKQRAMGKRLRRLGRSLLNGKAYTPVLTKPVEHHEQPQRQLYAIRGGKR